MGEKVTQISLITQILPRRRGGLQMSRRKEGNKRNGGLLSFQRKKRWSLTFFDTKKEAKKYYSLTFSSVEKEASFSYFLWHKERSKEIFAPPRPPRRGRMQPESRRNRRLSVVFGIAGHAMSFLSAAQRKRDTGWHFISAAQRRWHRVFTEWQNNLLPCSYTEGYGGEEAEERRKRWKKLILSNFVKKRTKRTLSRLGITHVRHGSGRS